MKENLKIKVKDGNQKEITKLVNSLGVTKNHLLEKRGDLYGILSGVLFMCTYDHEIFDLFDAKEITLPELRELARPKEYLNDKFELVVTNQPMDGWILVPDEATFATSYTHNPDYPVLFWREIGGKYETFNSFKIWIEARYGLDAFLKGWEKSILWQRNPKETTMNTEKKGRFLHQEWYEAFGRGEDVQFDLEIGGDGFDDVTDSYNIRIFNDETYIFRLKPQTMRIGTHTINKPISVKPNVGTFVFVSDATHEDKYFSNRWADSMTDNLYLSRNLCHLTSEDAVKMTDALLSLMECK